jgi:hypothetical protein
MLYKGNNITAFQDELINITIEQLYHEIQKPSQELSDLITRLRKVKSIDNKAYDVLKKKLPYFIGTEFTPQIRKIDYFKSITYFMIDIDHYSTCIDEVELLKKRLQIDNRIMLMFISPGGDGLKVLFCLNEPIRDSKTYSDFYKSFLHHFGSLHKIEKFLDYKTHDVTRVCFLSYDNLIYYNLIPEKINFKLFYEELPNLFELKENKIDETTKNEIDPDIYKEILKKFNPNNPLKRNKNIYVPEILKEIIKPIEDCLKEYQIEIKNIDDIQYGKKIQLSHQQNFAEINIFYGKKGFSVVITTKKNSHPDLGALAKHLCEQAIYHFLQTPVALNLTVKLN